MPEYGAPEEGAVERALEGLEAAVDRLLAELQRTRERAQMAEKARSETERALEENRGDGLGPEARARLKKLTDENRRLREIIQESRARAERIRSRLRAMEDDVSGSRRG